MARILGRKPITTRSVTTLTTSSIAVNGFARLAPVLAPGFALLSVSTDVPARVRFYTNMSKLIADEARALGTEPTGNHGLIMELATTTTTLTQDITPSVLCAHSPSSASAAISVQNTGTSAAAITVSFVWQRTE